jgi:four helix bundle protein
MYEYPFEKLKIWQSGKALAVEVCSTAIGLPARDKSGLSESLRHSALKLTSSLSEGNWKTSSDHARSSIDKAHLNLMELLSLIIVAHDMELISVAIYEQIREKINELSIMLLAFKKSLGSRGVKKAEESAAA